jgi:CDP-diacylglycerol--glycerol-3-phosphate 3-phosphatidyltransferase
MKQVPLLLVWFRLVLGILVLAGSLFALPHWRVYALIGLIAGLLTDIFDGIIARRLGVATERLRRLDSAVDLVFFLAIGLALAVQSFGFFREHAGEMLLLLGAEALTYVVGYLKFKKEMALHTWGAKLWSVILVATLAQLIWTAAAPVLFPICFWLGLVTRLEMLLIILVLQKWAHDVPGIGAALKLRREGA